MAQLHQHLLDMLGAKDHVDAGRIIGKLHAAALNEQSGNSGQLQAEQRGAGEVLDVRAAYAIATRWRKQASEHKAGRAVLIRCAEELEAALAARQPVGQEPRRLRSAEDRFEQFVRAEIARSPNALRELGEYLGRVLDEDEFSAANRLLLQIATEHTTPPAPVNVPYSLDADPAGIRSRVADCIAGTIMVGAQNHTPPPADHWLAPFWEMARAEAVKHPAPATPAGHDRMAIKLLVAAGFVAEEKANESLRIAHGFGGDLGQPAPAAVPVDVLRDADEDEYVIDRLAHLLAEIAVIVNGPEPAGARWSYHDLPEKVRALAARQPVGHEPAIFVSPEQLEVHADPMRGEGGHYLPARKSVAGKFTQPLYTAPPAPAAVPVEFIGVSEQISAGNGFWRACSGCHELNEGVETGPYSAGLRCYLGTGCVECGGIGAIWDNTDYELMADEEAAALAIHPQPAAAKDLAAMRPRIEAAINRIVSGHGCMRVPAEETDPDLVLADVLQIIDQQAKPAGEVQP
ncbi:hypothetical protein LL972_20395 [Xanthomonas campestris pv. asclepiadis]|uniref:hypothetical protein n=1 Tax=Xanthomonas campestris TaxID=339 RepID=UPI001E37C27A|nr:hypothetical protein [Xanthomonas campestris]MCC4618321.1 hypothetical protein [Xanthomonas campestris pv. asclepiadis]